MGSFSTPPAHAASHASTGDDPIGLATIVAPTTAGQVMRTADGAAWSAGSPTLTESGGPTVLSIAACPANGILLRSGSTVIGIAPSAAGSILQWSGTEWNDSSRAWAIAAASTPGILLVNTTAATAGVPIQYSPALQLSGTAHDTDGDVSVAHHCRIGVRPVNGNTTGSALHLSFATDAGAYTSRGDLTSYGRLSVSEDMRAAVNLVATNLRMVIGTADIGTGLGSISAVRCDSADCAATPGALVHRTRTDGANNIVWAVTYDRNAASITNAATMRLMSWNWVNNSDTNAELASVRCDGSIYGVQLRATGDIGGIASTTTLTNATVSAGSSAATLANAPAAAGQVGWAKIYIGTTAYVIPYWAAA